MSGKFNIINNKTVWITRTAAFVALLVAVQFFTAPAGQLVTGTLVNFILIAAAMIYGAPAGLAAALMSPFFAKFIGIGPLWPIVPFIMAGNAALVLIWRGVGRLKGLNVRAARIAAAAAAALCKFLILYVGVVRIAAPYFLALPERQAAAVTAMFSYPQLITALAGGALAAVLLPAISKARAMRNL